MPQRRGCLAKFFSTLFGPAEEAIPPRVLPQYLRTPSLLTPTEAAFFASLVHAVSGVLLICPKVRLGDLVRPAPAGRRQFFSALSQVNQKHLDFVLCDPQSFKPMVGIELDDPSHDRPDRMARDAFVDAVCASVGLPLLHIRTQSWYDINQLNLLISQAVLGYAQPARTFQPAPALAPGVSNHGTTSQPVQPFAQPPTMSSSHVNQPAGGAPAPWPSGHTQPIREPEPRPIYLDPDSQPEGFAPAPALPKPRPAPQPEAQMAPAARLSAPPSCPSCHIPMVVRTVRQGPHAGKQFYGCANYPSCRQMRRLE